MLQKMLNECVKCGTELDIIFNARKSCLFKVIDSTDNLVMGGHEVKWAENLKYLAHSLSQRG